MIGLGVTGVAAMGLDKTDPVACFNAIQRVTFLQNIIVSATVFLLLIFFREKPAYPPSHFAIVRRVITGAGLTDDFAVLRKNWNYIGNAWTFIVFQGTFVSIGNLLSPLFGEDYTAS